MFFNLFDSNEKQLNKIRKIVDKINSLEEKYQNFTDDQIKKQTHTWQEELSKLSNEKEEQKYLDNILADAYALVRESSKRSLGLRHYDVQLISGISLHQGKISEQKTGEGKTLTASLPLYLNALTKKGAHLVTPNDYLSRHGAGWMGKLYDFMGLSVGVIMQENSFVYDKDYDSNLFDDAYASKLKQVPRQQAYKCDILYGTNSEFGFDYLRDNMAQSLSKMVQTNARGDWGVHNFAIVDEVDSILIDVARTPLIISTIDKKPSSRYHEANNIVKSLSKGTDYDVDEKFKNANLTDMGIRRVERLLKVDNLYEQDFEIVHLIEQSLIAHALYLKDRDYVVKQGRVLIVDSFTGRILDSNRFSNGLHQAIEAKENVEIKDESKTMADISYQNYFRMYKKLAGMTGTAITEAEEFYKIYNLDVLVIPTNKKIARKDHVDLVYKSVAAKFKAVANEIEEKYNLGQPVLVGTTSVEKSELLHQYLKRKNIPHQILNAKNHEKEANIISQAGRRKSVTISTNMAGRGVDIILGGDPFNEKEQEEVKKLGGLHVIGTERHDSRRIDNQLRGRSGRQGDPGSSRFYISLQDDLMRIFGGSKVESMMSRLGIDENTPIESSIVSKAIENAQKKVESLNFDRRKQTLEYDDIMNTHRKVIYQLRRKILELELDNNENSNWLLSKLENITDFNIENWNKNLKDFGQSQWLKIVKDVSLPVIDMSWMNHLSDMDQLREGIGLRGYAQRDPMVEYKRESHERFEILIKKIYQSINDRINNVSDVSTSKSNPMLEMLKKANYQKENVEYGVAQESQMLSKDTNTIKISKNGRSLKVSKVESSKEKVKRNDPCPCGSGKKYKNCCGKSN